MKLMHKLTDIKLNNGKQYQQPTIADHVAKLRMECKYCSSMSIANSAKHIINSSIAGGYDSDPLAIY